MRDERREMADDETRTLHCRLQYQVSAVNHVASAQQRSFVMRNLDGSSL